MERTQTAPTFGLIKVLMKTGKHTGKIVTILDVPHVTIRSGSTVTSLLPGLEGVGTIVGDAQNN